MPDAAVVAADPRIRRALAAALAIAAVVVVLQVVGGLVAGSLALLGDAAHMVTDVAAYALALVAARLASRPPSGNRTFGHGRVEVLAALVNAATLIAASAWLLFEAARRLVEPSTVAGHTVVAVGGIGLVANVFVAWLLWRADRASGSMNVRGALLHALGDLAGSVAVVASGIGISLTGIDRIDPVTTIALVALIAWGAWHLLRAAVDVLLDSAPADAPAPAVAAALLEHADVLEVHDLHVWTIRTGHVAVTAHALHGAGADPRAIIEDLRQRLRAEFAITHVTIQLLPDRSSEPVETVGRLPLEEALEWATDHVLASRPGSSRSVVMAAAGAAALRITPGPDGLVSPVAVSQRTAAMLDGTATPPTD